MNLQEVFDQLEVGELSALSVGGIDSGGISRDNYGKIVPHINLGLIDLFKRFNLGQRIEHFTPDHLNNRIFAVNADTAHYLFDGKLIAVDAVYNHLGEPLPINRPECVNTIYTDGATVTVPEAAVPISIIEDEMRVTLHYRVSHPMIEWRSLGDHGNAPWSVPVWLPIQCLEALTLFVGSRAFAHISGDQQSDTNATLYGRYLAACKALDAQGTLTEYSHELTQFERGGWV